MSKSLVLGAGLVGAAVTSALLDRGDSVTVATRSGSALTGAAPLALHAADASALSSAAAGASTIFLCTNPPYAQWTTAWPPVFAAVVAAARASGASVVAVGNLYSYGRAVMPMTETSPELTTETKGLVRRDGWRLLLAAHERGEIRATEVRASDYFGPGASATAHLGESFFAPLLASKTARVVGDPTLAHSWAYLPDIAATLVAASAFSGEWGRIWHVPAATHASRVELARLVNEHFGTRGRVAQLPQALLRTVGIVNPLVREVYRSSYQFLAPFVNDATETERQLGVRATDSDTALIATAGSYRK